jgi:SpoVK/Ycf46/Vps4 family AAA+-type ATPase
MAPSRGGEIHEATRRILSVLLQRLEGFHGRSDNILVCATNRKQDLDAALISRFNVIIKYDLPDAATRSEIFLMYAKQLTKAERMELAHMSDGLSCRGLKDVCEQTERIWASKLIGQGKLAAADASNVPLPQRDAYAAQLRKYVASREENTCPQSHVSA